MTGSDMELLCQEKLEPTDIGLCLRGLVAEASVEGLVADCSCLEGFHVMLMHARRRLTTPLTPFSWLPERHLTSLKVASGVTPHATETRISRSHSQSLFVAPNDGCPALRAI